MLEITSDIFHATVIKGFQQKQRVIPCKFLYDKIGSQLFSKICHVPEYYIPQIEKDLLSKNIHEIADLAGNNLVLVELGSGNCAKTRILLDALNISSYIPIDISKEDLLETAEMIRSEYKDINIQPFCTDYTMPFTLPLKKENNLIYFSGSSISNFEPHEILNFLNNIHDILTPQGKLLISVDLKKDKEILHAAYNDAQNVTAEFNLNLLARMNRELNANFDLKQFSHHAFYNEERARIEMHLISTNDQNIEINGQAFFFKKGESIHTENSYKYTIEEFIYLLDLAGFELHHTWTDPKQWFSMHLVSAKT